MVNQLRRFVHIRAGQVEGASDKSMALLGNFLITQVGTKGAFFRDWLNEKMADTISSQAYVLQKEADQVLLEHTHADELHSFITTAQELGSIIEQWESVCKAQKSSACSAEGAAVVITQENGEWKIKFT